MLAEYHTLAIYCHNYHNTDSIIYNYTISIRKCKKMIKTHELCFILRKFGLFGIALEQKILPFGHYLFDNYSIV